MALLLLTRSTQLFMTRPTLLTLTRPSPLLTRPTLLINPTAPSPNRLFECQPWSFEGSKTRFTRSPAATGLALGAFGKGDTSQPGSFRG